MSTLTAQETLILVGAAMAAGCRPCLDVALGRALELGIDPKDLARARDIGCMAANRARSDMDEHARTATRDFFPPVGAEGPAMASSCTQGSSCRGQRA